MRILSITAGAAGMYCGSCSRDNALAVELLARGHDVTLLPLYTPTTTDETNVSRDQVLFGGISIYLQQHLALFRKTPRFLDRLWDSPRVIRAFASRSISTDPKLLGDLMISMLEGRRGVLRKEFDKLLEWLAGRAGAGRHQPAELAAHRPGGAAARRAEAAGLLHAAGRGSLSRRPHRAVSPARARPDSPAGARRRSLHRRQRLLRAGDVAAAGHSRRTASPSCRSGSTWRATSARPSRDRGDVFRVGYFARIAPEKGLHVLADAYAQFRRRTAGAPVRLEAAGLPVARARAVSRGGAAQASTVPASPASSRIAAPSIATASWRSCDRSTCCRCPRPTTSRRACSCSKRWRAACRWCSRVAARSPRSSRRRAAVCSSRRTIRRRWPTACTGCGRTARWRRRSARVAFDGVRAHYSIAAPRIGCSRSTTRHCRLQIADCRLTSATA